MMRRPARSIGIMATLVLFACTGCAQILYGTLQQGQSMKCQQMQSRADRNECLKHSDMSYDEYRRQLNEQKQDR